MPKIITEDCGDIAILRLNNGITNAVNPDLLKDCSTALNEIKKSCKGMIFAGGTKFFPWAWICRNC